MAVGNTVLLVQTSAVSNTPFHYAGDFTHHCHSGFVYDSETFNCDQCVEGAYKDGTNGINSCIDCPEGRYGLSGSAQSNISHCLKCPSGYYGPVMQAITW
jgi:hypothetical protein